jgi:hypothetical protein
VPKTGCCCYCYCCFRSKLLLQLLFLLPEAAACLPHGSRPHLLLIAVKYS